MHVAVYEMGWRRASNFKHNFNYRTRKRSRIAFGLAPVLVHSGLKNQVAVEKLLE